MKPRTCSYRCESGRTESSRSSAPNESTWVIAVAHETQVAVGQHRALRLAGRAAREDDLGERRRHRRRRAERLRAPGQVGQRLDQDDRQAEGARRRLGLAGGEDELRARLVDDLAPEVDGVADVERHRDAAGVLDGRNARPHSGRLTAQMIARSPTPRPASARTRAARGTDVARSR